MRRLFRAILAVILIMSASYVYADTVVLKSGKTVSGTIVEETARFIRLDIGQGAIVRYYLDEIKNIQRDPKSGLKTFSLEPSPLSPAQPQPTSSQVAAIDESKAKKNTKSEGPRPIQQSPKSIEGSPADIQLIEDVVYGYLKLVTDPLPMQRERKEERLREFNNIFDLENMNEYSLFRSILDQARRNNPKATQGSTREDSVKNTFFESQVREFQKRYLSAAVLVLSDFNLANIAFSLDQKQATAFIKARDISFKLKLHKVKSVWLIYSTH